MGSHGRRVETIGVAEADAVGEFFAACHAADDAVRLFTAEAFRSWAARARPHLAVVREGDSVIGFVYSTDSECRRDVRVLQHFRIFVLPRVRRTGVATMLLDWVCTLPLDGPRPGLQCSCLDVWGAGHGFLEARGFTRFARDLEMVRDPAPVAPPGATPGIVLRPLDIERDIDGWLRVHHAAYAGDAMFDDADADGLRLQFARSGAHALTADDAGEVVGFCLTLGVGDPDPRIENIAVHPSHQRRGIARALLRSGMIAADGATNPFTLGVFEDRVALGLYLSEGFREDSHEVIYRRDV